MQEERTTQDRPEPPRPPEEAVGRPTAERTYDRVLSAYRKARRALDERDRARREAGSETS